MLDHNPKSVNRLFSNLALGFVLFVGLYLSSLQSYLLFHTLAELFSIVVACGMFFIAWNSREFMKNNYLLFLGIAYMYVAGLDLVHTLVYQGMGIFPGYGPNYATQLWIAARFLESLCLLIAPMLFNRKLKVEFVFGLLSVYFLVVLAAIFYWKIFPVCFVNGIGLTKFKVVSEYIICLILVASMMTLMRKKSHFEPATLKLIVGSIGFTIAEELFLTVYVGVYDFSNFIGHYLKIVSFYLLYKAVIQTGLQKPYMTLFRGLEDERQALEQKTVLLAALLESIPDIVFFKDIKGAYLGCNTEFMHLVRLDREFIIGKTDYDLFTKEQADTFTTSDRITLEQKCVKHFERWVDYPEGRRVLLDTIRAPLRSIKGDIIGIVGLSRDITERKRAEEKLIDSEARLRSYFELPLIGVAITTLDKGWLEVNSTICDMLGYSKEELTGTTWAQLTHPEDLDADLEQFQRILSGEIDTYFMEKRFIRKDGDIIWTELSVGCVRKPEGSVKYTVALLQDISKRKQVQKERSDLIIKLQDSIAQIRTLSGLIPICSSCKKIRDDKGYWNEVERYIGQHSEAEFTHGICPDCMKKLYPEYADEVLNRLEKEEKK
jgi:PAS domain S-box-containing protein